MIFISKVQSVKENLGYQILIFSIEPLQATL